MSDLLDNLGDTELFLVATAALLLFAEELRTLALRAVDWILGERRGP